MGTLWVPIWLTEFIVLFHRWLLSGSVGGKINSVDLDNCDSEPCQLHRGTNYTAHINFTACKYTKTYTMLVVHLLLHICFVLFYYKRDFILPISGKNKADAI